MRKKFDTTNLTAVEIYKEVLKGNNIKTFPKYFWEKPDSLNYAKDITKFLIEDLLKWNREDIKNKLTRRIFIKNKLYGMLNILFKGSPYKIINNAYPNIFKQWELRMISMDYWDKETAKEATKWLIEEKLKWSKDDIKDKLSYKIFKENGFIGMARIFNDSPYNVLDNAYPGIFKPWELKNVSKNYWNKETAKEATIWLIEENLKWNRDDIKDKLNRYVFIKNGLSGMLDIVFNNSPYLAIDNAYPGVFKKSDLKGYK